MSWEEWAGSKPALARKVEEYACSIGKPYSEVLLTLLHEAVVDVQALDSEVGFLAGLIMDTPRTISDELDRRDMSQAELSRRAGVSQGCICNIVNGNRGASVATVRAIIRGLE